MTFCAFSSPVKILGIVVVSAILCAFTVPQAESKILIGVAMPTNTVLRWISDGHYIKKSWKHAVTALICKPPKMISPTNWRKSKI